MATLEELHQGLIKADAAGNAEDAKAFADAILAMSPPKKVGSGSDAIDAGNAVGTGYFRGLSSLAGLPVDTVANVIDLGKAAIGAPITAITGKTPDALTLTPRDQIVGSGQWIQKQARGNAVGRTLLDPVNPEYEGGALQTAGTGLAGVMRPNTWGQAANQAGLSVSGSLVGRAVYDATGDPSLAMAASLSPAAVQQAATGGARFSIRGGEGGRQDMAQRVQALKNAGVDAPTLGLASGNKFIGGAENLLQNTPGAVGIMGRSRDAAIAGLQSRTQEAADLASQNRGSYEAGRSIQAGIKEFKDQFKERQSSLYDRMDSSIDPSTRVEVPRTRDTLASLNSDIPGAPALSKQFKNGRIQAIEEALKNDTGGTEAVLSRPGVRQEAAALRANLNEQSQAAAARNSERARLLSNNPESVQSKKQIESDVDQFLQSKIDNRLPFEALKKTRTLVGNEIADSTIASSVPRSKWRPLYAALSDDMQSAANAAGPDASLAFNRASNYTRSGIGRLDRVAPFADTDAPEKSFQRLAAALKDNASTLQAVKKTLPEGARGDVAGTVIDRLGRAKNSAQNDAGSAWSPETFLTNWNAMSPKARAELFSGFKNSGQVARAVDDVAIATSMMRENSKLWANPSGTGANLAARGVLASVPAAAGAAATGLLNPVVPAAIGGTLIANRQLAKLLTSPGAIDFATSRNSLSPRLQYAAMAALLGNGVNQPPNQGK